MLASTNLPLIALGTLHRASLGAVSKAFGRDVELVGYDVHNNNEIPYGMEQILAAAQQNAQLVRESTGALFGIGIARGELSHPSDDVFRQRHGHLNFQAELLIARSRIGILMTGIRLPEDVEELRQLIENDCGERIATLKLWAKSEDGSPTKDMGVRAIAALMNVPTRLVSYGFQSIH